MLLKKLFSILFFFAALFASCTVIAQQKSNIADSIIKKTILYKYKNNPKNFEVKGYNRLIITANPDAIQGRVDSIFRKRKDKKVLKEIDSSDYLFKKIITKQHLYVTEKISSYRSKEELVKETIKATRMAGFNEPIFEYFSLELQPFSVYDEKYIVVEKKHQSPIASSANLRYNYHYLGTTTIEQRTVHKIEFQPKAKNKRNKLSGILYIDAEKYSIAKTELYVFGILKIEAVNEFKFNADLNNWFLLKNTLSIKKGDSKSPIRFFGEIITFEGNKSRLNPDKKKYATDFIEINSVTNFYNASFNSTKKIAHRDISIEIDEDAIGRKQDYWYTYFNDSTDLRSKPTYISLDTLAQKRRIENKVKIGRKVIKGYYPFGFFDLDMRYLIRYNNYEGLRTGLGGVTNERMSKIYKVEAYSVYGAGDGTFKGSLSNSFKLHNRSETWLGLSYTDDVKPIASTAFELDKRAFNLYDARPFNISTYYAHETWKAFIETKFIPKTESIWQISQSYNNPKFDYQFKTNDIVYDQFNATIISTCIEWNPFSRFMQTPNKQIEIEKRYPKFTFQFSKTIDILRNDLNFGKIDLRFNYQKKFNSDHKIMLLVEGGYTFGDTPITHLYNHAANNLNSNKILQRFTLAAKDKFETMYFNEFFSSKHIFTQLEYQFPRVEFARRVKPVFSFVTRYGLGDLEYPTKHIGISYKTLKNGFIESGIEMNQFYKGFGLVFYYRYGPNRLARFEDNIAFNLSFDLGL